MALPQQQAPITNIAELVRHTKPLAEMTPDERALAGKTIFENAVAQLAAIGCTLEYSVIIHDPEILRSDKGALSLNFVNKTVNAGIRAIGDWKPPALPPPLPIIEVAPSSSLSESELSQVE